MTSLPHVLTGLHPLPCLLTLVAACLFAPAARAQDHHHHPHTHGGWAHASHVIVPQRAGFPMGSFGEAILIDSVKADVRILEQTATTTLEIALRNPSSRQAEAIILLPVPDGAAISAFLFDGAAAEPTAQVLRRDEARRLYDEIVARVRDPALLEFAGYNLIRSSVFPLPPQGAQKVRITYEHLLEADADRIDYTLPRSESLQQQAPWDIHVDLQSRKPIATVYSPSHQLAQNRLSDGHITLKLTEQAKMQPGAFLLSYLVQSNGVAASLFAYPDPTVGGGYFLLIAGVPVSIRDAGQHLRREVTLVLDRSGSMAGEKIDQVRAAAGQIIDGLGADESFNIIDYGTTVSMFSPQPILRGPQARLEAHTYLSALRPGGGTNIHDALLEALRQKPTRGVLPIVLFLTDGLPTVGRTTEADIRQMVESANTHGRRIFTFGVGSDVNVPLLDRMADETRASATYVLPGEDVELKVAQVFKRLYGPVLASPALMTMDDYGAVTTRRVREVVPVNLPDVFEDDQLIVMGQYIGDDPLHFQLSGTFSGRPRTFAFHFDLDHATTRNAFVPRLWATRRITYLVDQIRQAGGDSGGLPVAGHSIFDDPRFAELAHEILRLSTEFGVLTEYTAFLATEGTDLSNWSELTARCTTTLDNRAVKTRSGTAALNQGLNFNQQKWAGSRDFRNAYVDERLNRVEVTGVQQICDRTFFKRGERWIDGRLVASQQSEIEADAVVEFGSPEYITLLRELVSQNRQGVLSLEGDLIMQIDNRNILIRNSVNE